MGSLLPYLAGILEESEEATPEEIRDIIRRENASCTESEILCNLENGMFFGLFQVKKEYKLSPRFSRCQRISDSEEEVPEMESYVKEQRNLRNEKHKRKLERKRCPKKKENLKGNFCDCPAEARSCKSLARDKKMKVEKQNEARDSEPNTSKLLVKKNSFQNREPYYDIFT